MYPEQINALETLIKHKDPGYINEVTFRNETKLILDSNLYATIHDLKSEGYISNFQSKNGQFHFELTLKGIHYKEVLKNIKIDKGRVRRAEIVSYVSVAIAVLTFFSKFFG